MHLDLSYFSLVSSAALPSWEGRLFFCTRCLPLCILTCPFFFTGTFTVVHLDLSYFSLVSARSVCGSPVMGGPPFFCAPDSLPLCGSPAMGGPPFFPFTVARALRLPTSLPRPRPRPPPLITVAQALRLPTYLPTPPHHYRASAPAPYLPTDTMHYEWDTVHYGWDIMHYAWDTVHYGWDIMHYASKNIGTAVYGAVPTESASRGDRPSELAGWLAGWLLTTRLSA